MAKSIQERLRAALAKQEADAKKKADRANDAHWRKLESRDARIDRGIERALRTGVARTEVEQRALDIEQGHYDSNSPFC
jgi:hypothetical protein